MNLPVQSPQVVSPTSLLTGEEARAYAKTLSESTMVGPFFRGSVPNMLYAMELGKLYNLEPAAILQNVHVFDSSGVVKAGLSANLMTTLARQAGHIVNTTSNPSRASTTIVRGDTLIGKILRDFDNITAEQLAHYASILSTMKDMGVDAQKLATTEVFWNEDKAITAGLFGKGNWAKYPGQMMAARSKSEAVRMACEEVLIQITQRAGIVELEHGPLTAEGQPVQISWGYTADELEGEVSESGETFGESTPTSQKKQPQREQATVTQIRPNVPPTDTASAKADIAAQAAASTAQAGWGAKSKEAPAKEEPAAEVPAEQPKKSSAMAEKVRGFVLSNKYEAIEKILVNTLTSEETTDEEDRRDRVLMIAAPAAEIMAVENLHAMLATITAHKPDLVRDFLLTVAETLKTDRLQALMAAVTEHQPESVNDFLLAVADSAPASHVAEILQDIALDESVTKEDRQKVMQIVYGQLKSKDRLDDPAPFHHKATDSEQSVNLGGAIKLLIQPIL